MNEEQKKAFDRSGEQPDKIAAQPGQTETAEAYFEKEQEVVSIYYEAPPEDCEVIGVRFIVSVIRCTHDKAGGLTVLNKIVEIYVTVVRGTPVMIQLMIIYFVVLLPVGVNSFTSAVICFGLNSGAYVSEIIRGGIMAVDDGQTEAGRSLGFGFASTMVYVVLPQAFKAVLPALCNEFIALLKETSIAFYIGVADLTQGGLTIRSLTYSNFMPLIAIALIYLLIVLFLSKLFRMLERRLRKSER